LFCQVDKATLIGETINFIKTLEETKAQLEKKKLEQALARQATAEAAAGGASSFSVARTAHGMAALSDGWDPCLRSDLRRRGRSGSRPGPHRMSC